ncbi:Sps1p [Rhizophagus irregularis DAOM 197198w]|uniref:Sps1p n=1 Tax=Rhizophagus irregularis (strain DAOM 197198w) TaxID=1432141 RepID=A0A015MR90_RHIIW|nr:Sps1p [Rhizophagus irregularis DAOM 197198w]
MQLKIDSFDDTVFEWIPYNRFNDIKELETDKDDFVKVFSAVWMDGPLLYCKNECEYKRSCQNKKVTLKCLYNSQNIINEVKAYSIKKDDFLIYEIYEIYGLSQIPDTEIYILVLQCVCCERCEERYTNAYNESCRWCKPCQINDLKNNFMNWTSGNENIDNLIQEMQLTIDTSSDEIFEWIPYSQFNNIKEISKNSNSATIYSALWKDGPLHWDENQYRRYQNKEVALKYLCGSQNFTNEFLNEVKIKVYLYSITRTDELLYGISQDPNTKDYIMVFQIVYCKKCGKRFTNIVYNWCKSCQISDLKNKFTQWTSGNEIIDNLIQEMQLKIENCRDIIFEWVPYSQFNDIKEIDNDDFSVIYSAIWKDGSLCCKKYENYVRYQQNQVVILKCLYNSQNITNDFLNEVKSYSIRGIHFDSTRIYGISQHPDLKYYILVLEYLRCEKCCKQMPDGWCKPCQISELEDNFKNWTSGNEKIDNLVREMQLSINSTDDIVFEWIPYDQFIDIKKIGKGGFADVYSAIWMDGPLHYEDEYLRNRQKEVALKCLHNSKNISDEFLNEIKAYSIKEYNKTENILSVYGITQNPDTKDYIMVLDYAKGLKLIHEKNMFHRDFHTGNILVLDNSLRISNEHIFISDMGLSGKVDNTDKTSIYGVTPYIAPEVLRGEPYTQAADIYSFSMIMYVVATGRQPFSNCAHDHYLVLDICKEEIRPSIIESEAPKCYIDLMKKCWDSNPNNRPNAIEIEELINLFYYSYSYDGSDFKEVMNIEKEEQHYDIKKQFKESEEYRKAFISSSEKNEKEISQTATHPEAIYTSRILDTLTKELHDECLDCEV